MEEKNKQEYSDKFPRLFSFDYMSKDERIVRLDKKTSDEISIAIFGIPLISKYDFIGRKTKGEYWMFHLQTTPDDKECYYFKTPLGINSKDIENEDNWDVHAPTFDVLKKSFKNVVLHPYRCLVQERTNTLPTGFDRVKLNRFLLKNLSDDGKIYASLRDHELRGLKPLSDKECLEVSMKMFGEPLPDNGLIHECDDGEYYVHYLWPHPTEKDGVDYGDIRQTGVKISDVKNKNIDSLSFKQYREALIRICLKPDDMTLCYV